MGRELLHPEVVPLGQLFMTKNAFDTVDTIDMLRALERHASGDYGEVGPEDWRANDAALKDGGRLMSVYWSRSKVRFWIITEGDRSMTTVLLPEDY